MEHLLNEWCIHFIDIRKNVELAHPRDVYWNMKAIYEVFEDIAISLKIAYGIKAIYEKTRECIMVLTRLWVNELIRQHKKLCCFSLVCISCFWAF